MNNLTLTILKPDDFKSSWDFALWLLSLNSSKQNGKFKFFILFNQNGIFIIITQYTSK